MQTTSHAHTRQVYKKEPDHGATMVNDGKSWGSD